MELFPQLSGTLCKSVLFVFFCCHQLLLPMSDSEDSDLDSTSSMYSSSDGSSSYCTDSCSDDSDSEDGLQNYKQAKKHLCLIYSPKNPFVNCWVRYFLICPPRLHPTTSRLNFFSFPRYDICAPAPLLLKRHIDHLEGWGKDMVRRAGLGSSAKF